MNIPDARRAGPGIGWRERRTSPRHAAVWVRIGGQCARAESSNGSPSRALRAGRSELGLRDPGGRARRQRALARLLRLRSGGHPAPGWGHAAGRVTASPTSGTHHHPRLAVSGHTRLSRMYCPRRHSVSSRQTSSSDQQIRHFGQGLASVAIAAPATAPRVPVIRVSHGRRLAEARHTRAPRPAMASGQATGPKSQLQAGRPASAS